jgi:beta-glucosidase/6-phospho-beta-glucosidase/beta-galactosidase/glycosyltransferase involved in cell wall biosynthesis
MSLSPQRQLPESLNNFIWAVGVECSILPHIKVDQFEWTQHDKYWREDFRMIKNDLGVPSVRYCLPWPIIEPQKGKFDWKWADERIDYITSELGLNVILDVMHFGCPQWLTLAVGDPEFPEALENLAAKLVERYRDRITYWCPFNEPLVTALFSGDFGFWAPHSRRWRGYMPVLNRIVQGTARATRAIRQFSPESTIILCDSCEHHHTRDESLLPEIQMRNLRRFAVLDLLTGRVDQKHPLFKWFTTYGFNEVDLQWLKSNRWAPDVIGLDYYNHTETQLEKHGICTRQKKPDRPLGLYGCAQEYWNRYGIPMMVTETSIDGTTLHREMWLEQTVADCKRLREEGIPLVGYTWWPFFDNIDWDGALLHHIGKIHGVGLYNLKRQKDGQLKRSKSPLAEMYTEMVVGGEQFVGELADIASPSMDFNDESFDFIPAAGAEAQFTLVAPKSEKPELHLVAKKKDAVEPGVKKDAKDTSDTNEALKESDVTVLPASARKNDNYGIIVFCHLRWGFVWQRPQQFVSRYAKKHPVLFIEEPLFDLKDVDARLFLHRVMPNVVVACPHFRESDAKDKKKVMDGIIKFARQAVKVLNDDGEFNSPILYYYNPMDVGWSLGQFNERAVVYDCMDELSQFQGAPKELLDNEARLLQTADVVFTGGYQMYLNKSKKNSNCHFFGCGVDVPHFAQALDPDTPVPPDIDFLPQPRLGWFGVIDERVDYPLLDKIAEVHPEWSIAMVGPVVKVDPNLLPHRPNLYWLGGRDYQVLPNYCKAFDVCLMPFAINSATQYINPTKALEYMATGRPIVGTAVADVIRNFGSVVKIANSHEEFIAACEQAIANRDEAAIQAGIEMASQNSWNSIVNKMLGLMKDAVVKRAAEGKKPESSVPRIETDEGILEISWSYPSVAGS